MKSRSMALPGTSSGPSSLERPLRFQDGLVRPKLPPKLPPRYAYQAGWIQANEAFTRGPNKGKYAFVATYNSASDSFKSFAATLGTYFQGVTDPATFGSIAVAHGENAGRGSGFVGIAQTFMDCLKAQN
jgi:hypothetical protein